MPLATRRERREIKSTSWLNKLDDLQAEEAIKRRNQRKSETDRRKAKDDWYVVDGIVGHRIDRGHIELEIKWEGYEETTWEAFDGFAKDSPREVEKYFARYVVSPFKKFKENKPN